MLLIAVSAILVVASLFFQRLMQGPVFLAAYAGVFMVCSLTSEVLRMRFQSWSTFVVPTIAFVSVGIIRLVDGSMQGMHRFGALYGAIFVGSALILGGADVFWSGKEKPDLEARFGVALFGGLGILAWSMAIAFIGLNAYTVGAPILILVAVLIGSSTDGGGGSFGIGGGCGGGCGGCGGG